MLYSEECSEQRSNVPLAKLCRICAGPSNYMVDIFSEEGSDQQLAERIQLHLSITVREDDCLPLRVCQGCVTWLKWSHELYLCAARSHHKLQQMLEQQLQAVKEECSSSSQQQQAGTSQNHQQDMVDPRRGVLPPLQCWQCEVLLPDVANFSEHQASAHNCEILSCISCRVFFNNKEQLQQHNTALHPNRPRTLRSSRQMPNLRSLRPTSTQDIQQNADVDKSVTNIKSEEECEDLNTDAGNVGGGGGGGNDTDEEESKITTRQKSAGTKPKAQSTSTKIRMTKENKSYLKPQYRMEKPKRKVHKPYVLPTVCKICGKDCKTYHRMQKHKQDEHMARVRCRYCELVCEGTAALRTHQDETHRSIPCSHCEEKFITEAMRDKHSRKQHPEIKPFICEICGKSLRQDQKYSHMLIHTNDNCLCDICGKSFKFKGYLRNHMRVHSNVRRKPVYVKCTICYKDVLKRRVEYHMNYHNGVRPFQCIVCRKSFFTKASLIAHKRIHNMSTVDCEICSMTLRNKKSYNIHIMKHFDPDTKNYCCAVCGEGFPTIELISVHCTLHPRDEIVRAQLFRNKRRKTNFQCAFCNKYQENKNKMRAHIMKHLNLTSTQSKFQCTLCPKSYSTFAYLANHMLLHEEENQARDSRLYKCQYCDRVFENLITKKVHESHHLDSKSIVCEICSQEFFTVKELNTHLKLEHFSEGLVVYNELMNSSYGTQFKCSLCNKIFGKLKYLRKHLEIHTGEKKFACDFCERRFLMKFDMQKHRLVHTGGFLYYCTKCEFGSNRLKDVKQHEEEMHLSQSQPPLHQQQQQPQHPLQPQLQPL